jgi:hypothetical protein
MVPPVKPAPAPAQDWIWGDAQGGGSPCADVSKKKETSK